MGFRKGGGQKAALSTHGRQAKTKSQRRAHNQRHKPSCALHLSEMDSFSDCRRGVSTSSQPYLLSSAFFCTSEAVPQKYLLGLEWILRFEWRDWKLRLYTDNTFKKLPTELSHRICSASFIQIVLVQGDRVTSTHLTTCRFLPLSEFTKHEIIFFFDIDQPPSQELLSLVTTFVCIVDVCVYEI